MASSSIATIPRDITSQAPQPQSPCHDHIAVPPHRTTLVSPSSHGGRPAASGTTADPPCGGLRVSTTTRRRRDAHGTAQPTRARVTHRSILVGLRSEEHTSELQSLMRISYAVFCL